MAYASIVQFRERMAQVPAGATVDARIQAHLDEATALIDRELGFAFAGYGAEATDRDFLNPRPGQYLTTPAYLTGSITFVKALVGKGTTSEATEVLTEWVELDTDGPTGGLLFRLVGWPTGWYRVTAKWGVGAAPTDVVLVCLEKAITLFMRAQGGLGSDSVGIDGQGAVVALRTWSNEQYRTLSDVRSAYGQFGIA